MSYLNDFQQKLCQYSKDELKSNQGKCSKQKNAFTTFRL